MDQSTSDPLNDTTELGQALAEEGAPAAPQPPPQPPPNFYRVDMVFDDYWRVRNTKVDAVLAWVLAKVFRVRIPCSTDTSAVDSLTSFLIPPSAVHESTKQRFAPIDAELAKLGFHSPIYHNIDDHLQTTANTLASYAHPTLPVVARIHQRIWATQTPAALVLFVEFITAYEDSGYLWTLSNKPGFRVPPSCRVVRKTDAPAAALWELHRQAQTTEPPFRKTLPAKTPQQVIQICDRLHTSLRDFHVSRGVFVPLDEPARRQIAASEESFRQAAAGTLQYPDVMIELESLQTRKSSWKATILILLISLGAFLLIGIPGKSSFKFLLALVPVLFFHECGHYLAMRLCGYKNLRMFFIPGFGAAVTGRAFNIPGWKRVVVYLMGPVPGVILGIIAGLAGMAFHQPLAISAGLLLIAINGFNLLPVLPLDGGQVLQTILFSRHYTLDVVFRVLAALCLLGMSIALKTKGAMFIAIPVLISVPFALHMGRTARQLRKDGFAPISPDSQTIPPAAAAQIITKLKSSSKKPLNNKILAQQTLQVFETLNTRPPGWLASASLLLFHLTSLVAALVFCMIFVVASRGSVPEFLRAAANRPHHAVTASEVRSSPNIESAIQDPEPHVTIVATFTNSAQARAAFDKAVADPHPRESVTLLGDTLLVRVPAANDAERKRWLDSLPPLAKDTFVQGPTMRAMFRLQGLAPSDADAKAIQEEAEAYFDLPLRQGLIPPWTPACSLTPQQRLARQTYVRLVSVHTYDDPDMKAIRQRIVDARRRGDEAGAKALAEESGRLENDLLRKGLQAVADDTSMDTDLARRYIELHDTLKPGEFYKTSRKELAPRLGLAADSSPACAMTRARDGYASTTGLVIEIDALSFEDPAAGISAVTAWLNAKGVHSLHYEIIGDPVGPDSEYDPEDPDQP